MTVDRSLVRRQMTGILRLELGRSLASRRSLALYFLALAPVGLVALWAMTPFPEREFSGPAEAISVFAGVFEAYLTVCIFFSTLYLFMNLFRAEILDRSLHYYFLAPVPRVVLAAGKYLAAFVASSAVFIVSTTLLFVTVCIPWGIGGALRYLLEGPGLANLLGYLGIVVLACAGYGSVFLLVGLFFRNPVVPAALLWLWELVNFLLPPLLKRFSVIHYLRSLYPVPPDEEIFAVLTEPTPAWIAVLGLAVFTALVLVCAGWRARRMEISYGGE